MWSACREELHRCEHRFCCQLEFGVVVCRFRVGIHSVVDWRLRLSLSVDENGTKTTGILLFPLCHSIIYQYYIIKLKSMGVGDGWVEGGWCAVQTFWVLVLGSSLGFGISIVGLPRDFLNCCSFIVIKQLSTLMAAVVVVSTKSPRYEHSPTADYERTTTMWT